MVQRFLGCLFLTLFVTAFLQCARKGTPTGGDKDITPPVLIKSVPPNMATNFKEKRIRLYFDEYIKLNKVQEQLIVSPPLKYPPQIKPQGGTSKMVEILIKDTLLDNTTYTFNFGYSIVDNNEGNPNSFLTYVFSTGDYIDSLSLSGVVKDAFNRKADTFISVLLYQLDSTFTDSTVYKKLPNYITNTRDSTTIFHLKNLKEGTYALYGLKDVGNNNRFDQKVDKIAFLADTISIPADSIYLLTLFKEIPDYTVSVPNYAAKNKIIFGFLGNHEEIEIEPLTSLPDTVRTLLRKERDKDSLNFWFTPFEADSLQFTITNHRLSIRDTFTIKTRKLPMDTLVIAPNQRSTLEFEAPLSLLASTPLVQLDSSKIYIVDKDSVTINFAVVLDTLANKIDIDFERLPNQKYNLAIYKGGITDFFGSVNDTLKYQFGTGSYSDFGNLSISISGGVKYPLIVQLTDEKGLVKRTLYASDPKLLEFNLIPPGKYVVRVIFDENENQKWDTGTYLKKVQPEKVHYYPGVIEVRANWEIEQTFVIPN